MIANAYKGFTHKKGVYKSWIMSYFSLIIVFFFIFNGVALLSGNLLQEEVLQANKSVFGLISSDLENVKNELDKMSMQIMLDPDVADMLKDNKQDNNYYLKVNKVRNNLQKLMASFSYAEKVMFYKHNADILFVDGGLFDADRHYSSYLFDGHTAPEDGYAGWKEFVSGRHNQELYAMNGNDVVYIHSIRVSNEIVGTAMIVLNKWAIENILKSLRSERNVNVLILNGADDLVFALQDDTIKHMAEQRELQTDAGQRSVDIDGENVIMFVSDQRSNFKCVYTVPSSVYYGSTNLFRLVVLIVTVLFIAIGCFFAFYNSRKNYMPVKQILGLLEKHRYENPETDDEFAFINEALSEIISEGTKNKITGVRYNKKQFASELAKLLTENVYSRSIEEVFDFYNISFAHSRYITAVVLVDDINEDIWGEDIISVENTEEELIEVVFGNICGEILGEDYNILTITLNNMYFCLIGTNRTDTDQIKEDIRNGFSATKALAREKIGIDYSVYASEIFDELGSLKEMYNQINEVYMFNRLIDESVLFYEDIDYSAMPDEDNAAEERMRSAVQKGDLKTINSLMARMIVQKQATDSPLQLAYVKYNILNILSHSIENVSRYNGDIYLLIEEVNRSSSVIEFLRPLSEFIENLCEMQSAGAEKSGTDVVDRLIDYVNKNYADSNMNVDQLGSEFSLSPSYLSNLFKLKTGEMLRDHIAKVRLQNARKLLVSDMKVEEVAVKSGFVSSKSFIRVFKRYFGITPSQYKKENQSQQ